MMMVMEQDISNDDDMMMTLCPSPLSGLLITRLSACILLP